MPMVLSYNQLDLQQILKFNKMKKHYLFLFMILGLGSFISSAQVGNCDVEGCTDENACNYDASANVDD